MKEHLYSTSVVIVTINGGMDDNVNESFLAHLKKKDHLIYESVL